MAAQNKNRRESPLAKKQFLCALTGRASLARDDNMKQTANHSKLATSHTCIRKRAASIHSHNNNNP